MLNSKNAISQFKCIDHLDISENKDDGFLDVFLLPINARNFDYDKVADSLLESVADYALSRKIIKKYEGRSMALSREARGKFREIAKNDGELGELLLFCLLEGHLEAPKILTKLELKTSNQLYVNGSDGVHLKKVNTRKYQLIFGESKTYSDLSRALENAFKSISDFKDEINTKGNSKSGISFEKGLISSNIEKEIFDEDEDEELLNLLLYPGEEENSNLCIEDAFSIFIGYDIDISDEQKNCSNDNFPIEIENKVKQQLKELNGKIYDTIQKYKLLGYTFYVFIIPFTNIAENRRSLLKRVLK